MSDPSDPAQTAVKGQVNRELGELSFLIPDHLFFNDETVYLNFKLDYADIVNGTLYEYPYNSSAVMTFSSAVGPW